MWDGRSGERGDAAFFRTPEILKIPEGWADLEGGRSHAAPPDSRCAPAALPPHPGRTPAGSGQAQAFQLLQDSLLYAADVGPGAEPCTLIGPAGRGLCLNHNDE